MTRYARLLVQLFLLLLVPLSGLAQTNSKESKLLFASDLSSTVAGTKTSYLELIRRILPDLHLDPKDADIAIAHKTIPFKHLSEATPPAALESDIKLDSFQSRWIKSDGRQVLLLELSVSAEDANQGTNYEGEADIVAAFTIQPAIKLLDVMDVKTDRFSGFYQNPSLFPLTADNDAFVVNSSHSNAGESYNDLSVLFLNHDRIETITGIFLFDTQGCGATFTQTPSFRVLPGNTSYPNIMVTVKVKKDADSQDCDHPTRGYVRTYQALYTWDRSKREYRTTSRQFAALDKFNKNRL
ncbi:MAG TPA: hypothetical protein VKB46_10065 [Pyrinomonadaceae bacterium]|nr:hypothetical protein [Pyrinomonadaceae bacterium]